MIAKNTIPNCFKAFDLFSFIEDCVSDLQPIAKEGQQIQFTKAGTQTITASAAQYYVKLQAVSNSGGVSLFSDEQTIITEKTTTYAHEITVEGFQWSWQFGYPDAGPKALVTGTPEQTPTMVVPLGERVRYTLTANDVVHGFWIPAFMIQMQNLPGLTNSLEFTANKLGEFPGRCNILCGRNHSQMLFKVKVVTPAEFDAYLETLRGGQA
mgnify:CR=1 FL=1